VEARRILARGPCLGGQSQRNELSLCILSNTRHPERLARLAAVLEIETFRGKFKPSTHMYEMALAKFGKKPEEAVMIGDQIMTDVLGANRSGIDAIWVQKMEGPEFVGTKIQSCGGTFGHEFALSLFSDSNGCNRPSSKPAFL